MVAITQQKYGCLIWVIWVYPRYGIMGETLMANRPRFADKFKTGAMILREKEERRGEKSAECERKEGIVGKRKLEREGGEYMWKRERGMGEVPCLGTKAGGGGGGG